MFSFILVLLQLCAPLKSQTNLLRADGWLYLLRKFPSVFAPQLHSDQGAPGKRST